MDAKPANHAHLESPRGLGYDGPGPMPGAAATPPPVWSGLPAWARFARRAFRRFLSSEVRREALWLFTVLLFSLVAINLLNVINSYVGRDFVTAIESLDWTGFAREAAIYVGVFAASTVAAVFCRYMEDRLGLLSRYWLTGQAIQRYLDRRVYYRLNTSGQLTNPDQRIADDVRVFTTTTLALLLILLNGSITIVLFSGVLWSISPWLFTVAVGYALLGSLLTFYLGRPLMALNYAQSDKEANFRTDLVHVRHHADSVALLQREPRLRARLLRHLDALTNNFGRIIAVHRNLSFFTTGYNYLIQLIPPLIVGPLFMRGEVEFGVITQSAMAFSHLLGAFSLIVNQFQSISSYAAVVSRLSDFADAAEQELSAERESGIELVEDPSRLAFEALTLRSPRDGRVLTDALTFEVAPNIRLLVRGTNDTAKVALVRATAGLWRSGSGRILRPGRDDLHFLPERPYLPPGTLREVVMRAGREREIPDEQIEQLLTSLGLEKVLARVGGLDIEREWDHLLSLDEQQLLACARLLLVAPRFAFLDRIGTALSPEQVDLVLRMIAERAITCIAVGNHAEQAEQFDAVLELDEGGHWSWRRLHDQPS